jgi:hypothetical protein
MKGVTQKKGKKLSQVRLGFLQKNWKSETMHAEHINRRTDCFLVRGYVLLNIKDRSESRNWK